MNAIAAQTSAVNADGEGVWSWHPDAGVKLAKGRFANDGGKKARFPGESALTRVRGFALKNRDFAEQRFLVTIQGKSPVR
jgi:hypothetical protein